MTVIEICALIVATAGVVTAIVNTNMSTRLWAITATVWALEYLIK